MSKTSVCYVARVLTNYFARMLTNWISHLWSRPITRPKNSLIIWCQVVVERPCGIGTYKLPHSNPWHLIKAKPYTKIVPPGKPETFWPGFHSNTMCNNRCSKTQSTTSPPPLLTLRSIAFWVKHGSSQTTQMSMDDLIPNGSKGSHISHIIFTYMLISTLMCPTLFLVVTGRLENGWNSSGMTWNGNNGHPVYSPKYDTW